MKRLYFRPNTVHDKENDKSCQEITTKKKCLQHIDIQIKIQNATICRRKDMGRLDKQKTNDRSPKSLKQNVLENKRNTVCKKHAGKPKKCCQSTKHQRRLK
jgi:hypothetical protein